MIRPGRFDVDVAIVGAGFCGATLAMRLADVPTIRTAIFERDAFACGVAYATDNPRHVLNVATARMSPFPERPEQFCEWLQTAAPGAYVPRQHFARYLRSMFDARVRAAPQVTCHAHSVASIVPERGGFVVTSEHASTFARCVVIAVGNFPPGDDFIPSAIRRERHYFRNPWALPYERLAGDILLIGNGLTAMDALVELHHRDYPGRVTMLSRHGRHPATHKHYGEAVDVPLDRHTAAAMVRSTRRAIADVERTGGDWRAVVDGIRPQSQAIWHAWPPAEQRRFLRHARTFWESSRRRIPPEVAAVVEATASSGQLAQLAGRMRGIEKLANQRFRVVVENAKTTTSLEVDAIVNCTGPQVDVTRIDDALIRSLVDSGTIAPHATRIGIAARADGAVVDARGVAHVNFFALGSMLRGVLYETVAVPELREQVKTLADALIAALA